MPDYSVRTILTGAAATLAVGTLGYAVYFDYQRRNDPAVRRKIVKERLRLEKASSRAASAAQAGQKDQLRAAVRQMKNEPVPSGIEERESYFLNQVSLGEALSAKGPNFYVPAAIAFFKGLQVYPQPQELLMIYSKTQPAEVVSLLMEALKLSIAEGESTIGGGSSRPRGPSGNAVLEEIDIEESSIGEVEEKEASASSATAEKDIIAAAKMAGIDVKEGEKSEAETNASSPVSGAGSYVDVETPNVPAA